MKDQFRLEIQKVKAEGRSAKFFIVVVATIILVSVVICRYAQWRQGQEPSVPAAILPKR